MCDLQKNTQFTIQPMQTLASAKPAHEVVKNFNEATHQVAQVGGLNCGCKLFGNNTMSVPKFAVVNQVSKHGANEASMQNNSTSVQADANAEFDSLAGVVGGTKKNKSKKGKSKRRKSKKGKSKRRKSKKSKSKRSKKSKSQRCKKRKSRKNRKRNKERK